MAEPIKDTLGAMLERDAALSEMRSEGRRLVSRGRALLDRADRIEAAWVLGEPMPVEVVGPTGCTSGLTAIAREMADEGWVTAQALAERTGCGVRHAASCLSRLRRLQEFEGRKYPGYPAEYRTAR